VNRKIILWPLVPICGTLYQIFVKLTADQLHGVAFNTGWLEQAGALPWLWAALASEIAAFFVWMQILARHELSKAFPLTAISYVFILAVSWFGFKEEVLPMQLLGGALILYGVWLIGTADNSKGVTT